jgi:hypothetical protein
MIKTTFVVAAIVAAAAYTTQASSARTGAMRHAQAQTANGKVAGCVRAPNVGAFASDPYTAPPCMPGTAN